MPRKVKGQQFLESIYPDVPDAWEKHVKLVITINEETRQLCQQHLAERRADMEAERDNPEMYRYHAAQAAILQAQIDHHTAIIDKYTAPPPPRRWIPADRPPRSRSRKNRPGNPPALPAPRGGV